MTSTTKQFLSHLDGIGVRYRLVERAGRADIVSLNYKLDNGRVVEIIAFFEQDGKNAALRCYTGISLTPSTRFKAFEFINAAHSKYRCVKFYLDEDELAAGCDMLLPSESIGSFCYRYLELFIYVLNGFYTDAVDVLIKQQD